MELKIEFEGQGDSVYSPVKLSIAGRVSGTKRKGCGSGSPPTLKICHFAGKHCITV